MDSGESAIPFSFPSQLKWKHILSFNPLALRKAKIVYNSGLSECKRVKSRSYFRGTLLRSKAIRKSQKLSSAEKMASEYLEAPKHLKAVCFMILSVFI